MDYIVRTNGNIKINDNIIIIPVTALINNGFHNKYYDNKAEEFSFNVIVELKFIKFDLENINKSTYLEIIGVWSKNDFLINHLGYISLIDISKYKR